MERSFAEGDFALIVDPRGREYLQTLGREKVFQSHMGLLAHEPIIGRCAGSRFNTHSGHQLIVLRPTLVQYVMNMRRTSQIIYPKDVGPILVYGDIYPGATVVEAGIGSGALTLALLRAVAATEIPMAPGWTIPRVRSDMFRKVKVQAFFYGSIHHLLSFTSFQHSTFRLLAIPEPLTYAGIFGLFILIGVMRFRKELGRAKRPR